MPSAGDWHTIHALISNSELSGGQNSIIRIFMLHQYVQHVIPLEKQPTDSKSDPPALLTLENSFIVDVQDVCNWRM